MTFFRVTAELRHVAIISWPVPTSRLAPMLPYPLIPETIDDAEGWGLVSMAIMVDHFMGSRYPQLNERTYVKRRDRTGGEGAFFWRSHARTQQAGLFRNLLGIPIFYADLTWRCDSRRYDFYLNGRLVAALSIDRPLKKGAQSVHYPKLSVDRAIALSSRPMIGYTIDWGVLCETPVVRSDIHAPGVTVVEADPSVMIPASAIDPGDQKNPLVAVYQDATPFWIDLPPRPVLASCWGTWKRAFAPWSASP